MPNHDALNARQDAPDFKQMKHTVNLRHLLARIFKKKYQPLVGTVQKVVLGTRQTTEHGEISAHKNALGLALLIQGMRGYLIRRELAPQQTPVDGIHGIALATHGNAVAHRIMDAHHTCRHLGAVQGRGTKNELGGSHFALVRALKGGKSPSVDIPRARRTFYALHRAIREGLVRAAHDLSEGGLAAAAAEMAFAGNLGAELWTEHLPVDFVPGDRERLAAVPGVTAENAADAVRLFSESNSRFLVEVPAESAAAFEAIFAEADVPLCQLGKVTASDRLTITGTEGKKLIDRPLRQLKAVWQKAFDLGGDYQ